MDPNSRLRLNFAAGGYNTDHTYPASNERVYPTTPSTFPQPIFPNQGGQSNNDYIRSQHQHPAAYAGGGAYFMNGQYPQQFGQQQQNQYQAQYQQQNLPAPQPSYQQRQGGYNTNDVTTGLAHQFSNQNLGSTQRQGSPFGRQQSPNQRPRTAGAAGQQNYGNHLTPPMPGHSNSSQTNGSHEPPEKNPDRYSPNVAKRGQALHALVEAFFKENIGRARDRNLR